MISTILARAHGHLAALARDGRRPAGHGVDCKVETAPDTAVIYIFEEIGLFGVWAAELVPLLAALDVAELQVRLSSGGGDFFDAVAIANALVEHPARVVVHVDGLAASAASVIAMAGDEIVMHPGSRMMIHDALTWTIGNAGEHLQAAELLDSVSADMAELYAARTGRDTPEEWRARMLAETWFSADEAVAAGLAERVATREPAPTEDEPAEPAEGADVAARHGGDLFGAVIAAAMSSAYAQLRPAEPAPGDDAPPLTYPML